MNLGSTIRKNTAWIFSGGLLTQSVKFFVGIALARILAPDDFGLLVTVQIFTGGAGFIAGAGMGQALMQAKEVDRRHYNTVFTIQLLICVCIYAFFYHISPYFAAWYQTPLYEDLLRVSALSFLIRPFSNISGAKLRRDMRFKSITINSMVALTIGSSTSIYLALNGFGVWSLISGGLISAVYTAISLMLISKNYPKFYYNHAIAKTIGAYGIKVSINDIVFYLKAQTPNFIIGAYMAPANVGIFNKGSSLSALPVSTISGSAYQTVFRALSSVQENLDQSKYIYLRTITLVTVYTVPFYIGLLWLSEAFVVTVYGEKWLLSALPLQILSIGGLFRCITNPSGAVMAAQNLLGTEIKIQLIALIMTAAGVSYGVLHESLLLISLGLLPSIIFLSITLSYFALRQLNASYKDLFRALKPALKLNIFLALTLAITHIEIQIYLPNIQTFQYLIILSASGGIVYGSLFLFYPIRELEQESKRWKKLFRLTRN